MAESKSQSLPQWRSLDELVEYFDTHNMGKYLEKMPEVEMVVDIKRKRHLVSIDGDTLAKINEAAKKKSVSSEELINMWLREQALGITPLIPFGGLRLRVRAS